MKSTRIIIADINKRNAYGDFYSGDHKFIDNSNELLRDNIKEKCTSLKVIVAYSFNEIDDIIKNTLGEKTIVFSNFPANNTYRRYKTETKDGVTGYVADGYSITSRKYKNLLNNNVELHIITGASENILSNEAIVSLFNENKIYVKRKSEWFNKKTDFMDNYESYILEACQI